VALSGAYRGLRQRLVATEAGRKEAVEILHQVGAIEATTPEMFYNRKVQKSEARAGLGSTPFKRGE